MGSPNKQELYRLGVQSAKSGQRDAARMMFQQVLQQDNRHVNAMLWMAKIANTLEDRENWLRRVLKIDPDNTVALKGITRIETRDEASRNFLYFRVGIVAYVVVIMILSLITIALFT